MPYELFVEATCEVRMPDQPEAIVRVIELVGSSPNSFSDFVIEGSEIVTG